jgi:hypothetical protein
LITGKTGLKTGGPPTVKRDRGALIVESTTVEEGEEDPFALKLSLGRTQLHSY